MRTETQVLPLNLKFIRESLYKPSATVVKAINHHSTAIDGNADFRRKPMLRWLVESVRRGQLTTAEIREVSALCDQEKS